MATTYRLTRLAREYAGLHEVIEAAQAGRRPFRVWRQDDDVDDGEGHSDEEADDPDGDGEDRVVLRGPREHVLRLDGRPDPETGTHVVSVDMFEIVTTPARLLASPLVTPESRAQLCQRKSFFARKGKASALDDERAVLVEVARWWDLGGAHVQAVLHPPEHAGAADIAALLANFKSRLAEELEARMPEQVSVYAAGSAQGGAFHMERSYGVFLVDVLVAIAAADASADIVVVAVGQKSMPVYEQEALLAVAAAWKFDLRSTLRCSRDGDGEPVVPSMRMSAALPGLRATVCVQYFRASHNVDDMRADGAE